MINVDVDIVKGETDVYFTSDLHLGHKNIVTGTTTWEGQTRDFQTVEEHDEQIINNINARVRENDHLFMLGDFSFKGFKEDSIERFLEYRAKIKCKNIYFVYGNHDKMILLHPELQAMFTRIGHYFESKITIRETNKPNIKHRFVLSHYSFRTWDGMYQGVNMLYGHSHNMLPEYINDQGLALKTMDVGIDTRHDMSPYSLDEVIAIMETKEVPKIESRLSEYNNKR